MIPLIDTHCHLLAGLDDGPATQEEALAMCRLAYADGTRMAAATAHQNDRWPDVTPERIRSSWNLLVRSLQDAAIPLLVFPCAEVMVHPDIETAWADGHLLGVAGQHRYLLMEMPHGCFVDLEATVRGLTTQGVRPILAHPERHEELLHEAGQMERLIEAGCLVQVSSSSVTLPRNRTDAKARKGLVPARHRPLSRLGRPLVHQASAADGGSVSADPAMGRPRRRRSRVQHIRHGHFARIAVPSTQAGAEANNVVGQILVGARKKPSAEDISERKR